MEEEIARSNHDEACMTITIRSNRTKNKEPVISIGACGKKQGDQKDAFVEDADDSELPEGTVVNELNEAVYVSNPCIYIRINGRLKKVCW